MANVDDRDLAAGRLYGKAILSLAEEQGQSDSLLEELAGLADYLDGNPEFERFLASPLVDEEERGASLERIFRGRASDLLLDSLLVINRKGRLGLVRAIAEGYRLEYRELHGLVDVKVRTAVPLNEPLRARLRETLAGFTGKQPFLIERVDPALIAGLVVEVDGQKLDTSVASRLRDFGAALERRASQEIYRSRTATGE